MGNVLGTGRAIVLNQDSKECGKSESELCQCFKK
jgi:hypothetical protein